MSRSLAALLTIASAVLLSACGRSSTPSSPPVTPTVTATAPVATPAVTPTAPTIAAPPAKKPKPKPSPGSLPQTDQLPSSDSPVFHAEMHALWDGVRSNSLTRATPAFFPEGAYVQIKAIGNAQGDYASRLVGDYRLDLAAAHALLAGDPAGAELVRVQVPGSYAHWVQPGVCDNRVGYYEVPNARVLYRLNGAVHSFGIASMISWRGVWYVIHLGAILRSSAAGVVDDPSLGAGVSAPSATC